MNPTVVTLPFSHRSTFLTEHMCREDLLRRHFAEAYPGFQLVDCKIAFDVAELTSLNDQLINAKVDLKPLYNLLTGIY